MADISARDIVDLLPKAGNNQSIAVGFTDLRAFQPFTDEIRKILRDYKKLDSDLKKAEQQAADKKDKDQDKAWKDFQSKILTTAHKQEQTADANLAAQREIAKSIKDTNDNLKTGLAYLQRGLNFAFDVLDKQFESANKLGKVYQDIETNGVFLKEGFDDLGKTAHTLGMTYDDLASHLKKTSPLIARLNGSFGNGIKSFTSAIGSIDNKLNLTNSEKVAIFENVLSKITPDQLMKMSQEDMNIEINRTAKEMKMLSLATGKSVELINQENAQKEQAARNEAWRRSHKAAADILKQSGLSNDEDVMEYIRTGGTKMTPGLLTKMQNDPFAQKFLPEIAKAAARNQLDTATFSKIYQQNKHLSGYKTSYANKASMDPAQMMAGGASSMYENATFYSIHDLMQNTSFGNDIEKEYYSDKRKDANAARRNYDETFRRKDALESDLTTAKAGGEKGVAQTFGIGSKVYGALAGGAGLLAAYAPGGLAGALLTGAALTGGEHGLRYAGDLIFNKAVNKFARSVGNQNSFIDKFNKKGILGSIDKRTKLGKKLKPLINLNDKVSKTWLGKNINVGFGKHKLRLGAVSSGLVKGGLASGGGWLLGAGNNYLKEKGYVEEGGKMDTALKAGSKALSWGGNGAMLGSVFGPLGTAVGGIGGALLGAGVSLWDSWKQSKNSEIKNPNEETKEKKRHEDEMNEWSSMSNGISELCNDVKDLSSSMIGFCKQIITNPSTEK